MGTLENSAGLVPVPLTYPGSPATASGNYGPNSYAYDRNTPVVGADLVVSFGTFGLQVNLAATVAPTTFTAQLQGSLDGLNWYNLGTALNSTTAPVQYVAVADSPARYVRVALTITGGTNVAATAWLGVSE